MARQNRTEERLALYKQAKADYVAKGGKLADPGDEVELPCACGAITAPVRGWDAQGYFTEPDDWTTILHELPPGRCRVEKVPFRDRLWWYFIHYVWRPFRGQCAWCGIHLEKDEDAFGVGVLCDLPEQKYGWRTMCYGCYHYSEE